jgi:hypothetical protein
MRLRRGLVLAAGLALVAAAPAHAEQPPPVIANGVTVAGLAVGGMTGEQAVAAVQRFFDRPLVFRVGRMTRAVSPRALSSRALVGRAVGKALAAPAGSAVPLDVVVNQWRLKRWVAALGRRFHRPARNSAVVLRRLRPRITRSKRGRELKTYWARAKLTIALKRHARGPVSLPARTLRATRTRRNFGPVIVIRRDSKHLILYRGMTASGMRAIGRFGVATGMAAYPTPLGRFTIVTKQRNPWWYPPQAGWAAGASPIPPGPGNPLGTRWMGLSIGGVGIHGTPDASSIGYSASHGCIRMRIPAAEWLFERVRVGTTVFIVGA